MIDIQDAINDYDDTMNGDIVQSHGLNNMFMAVDEGIDMNDLDAELVVDEEESHLEGDDETAQHHSPSTPSEGPGLGIRSRLAAMLSETSLKLDAKALKTAQDVSRILTHPRPHQTLSQAVEGHHLLS